MKVQFNLKVVDHKGKKVVHACNVSGPGGKRIQCQDDNDAKQKEFVGGQFLRYSGTLKFYLDKKGYGYIDIDDGFDYQGEKVPKQIRVEKSEMNAGPGNQAKMMKDVQVEFGIWMKEGVTPKVYKAYNVTLPGGEPLPS